MSPPDSVWNAIERDMAGSETALMKRRVVFYQRIAAATVIFALVTGAIAIYNYRGTAELANNNSTVVSSETASAPETAVAQPDTNAGLSSGLSPTQVTPPSQTPALAQRNVQQTRKAKGSDNNNQYAGTDGTTAALPTIAAITDETPNDQVRSLAAPEEEQPVTIFDRSEANRQVAVVEQEQEPVAELLSADQINALAEARAKEEKDKEKGRRSLWVGVAGAAGSYTPKAEMSGGAISARADQYSSLADAMGIPQSVGHSVGSAYSAGLSGGIKLSKRWVLQSGLNYVNQQVDHTTNFVGISDQNRALAMTSEYFDSKSLAAVTVTNAYEVSSTTEVLSVPVQAGFLIVDRKLGWQLNTGMSTDFFLRNTLADKSGTRDKISEGGGEDSPYRSVNFSGLLNTELSYRIGHHYRIALVPGVRYSLQPLLKEQTSGTPLFLDVGFRFNYLFK